MAVGATIQAASGLIDGVNRTYSVPTDYKSGTLIAILNGMHLLGVATELGGTGFEMPTDCIPSAGDTLHAYYFSIV